MSEQDKDKKSGMRGWLSDVFHDSDVKGIAKLAAFFVIIGMMLTTCSALDSASDYFKNNKDADKVNGTIPNCTSQTTSNVVVNNKAYTLTCR